MNKTGLALKLLGISLGLIVVISFICLNYRNKNRSVIHPDTAKSPLLIPINQAKYAGDWELPVVVNSGDFGIQDKVKLSEVLANPDVKAVVITFWATWNEPCNMELPYLQKIWKEYKDNGLLILGITVDANPDFKDEIRWYINKLWVTYPIPWDIESKVKSFYDIGGIPVTYLIDKNGKIRYEHTGFTEELIEDLEKAIKELLFNKLSFYYFNLASSTETGKALLELNL